MNMAGDPYQEVAPAKAKALHFPGGAARPPDHNSAGGSVLPATRGALAGWAA